MDAILPFVLCSLGGALLAAVELIRTFGKWIGRYWFNRYVTALIVLNMIMAMVVYAFLRYVLGIENNFWLAIVTGLTFPTILRSRFTFYRPFGQSREAIDTSGFSLTIDGWYRNLQNLCYEEVNKQIAGENSRVLTRLKRCLTEKKMISALWDHIASEPMANKRADHSTMLTDIRSLSDDDERRRRLGVLMMEIMPEPTIKLLLEGCDQ